MVLRNVLVCLQQAAAQNQAEREVLAQQNEWREADTDPDDSLHDTDEHLSSPWQTAVQDDDMSQTTKKTRSINQLVTCL